MRAASAMPDAAMIRAAMLTRYAARYALRVLRR